MKMRAVQVAQPNGPLEVVEREIPESGPGQVRVKVEACGICHSDSMTKQGLWPGIQYPRVPGHEIAGTIDQIGSAVTGWTKGQRVSIDSQDTLSFSELTGVRPMIELFPLERAAEAYERMISGKARFRAVLTTGIG